MCPRDLFERERRFGAGDRRPRLQEETRELLFESWSHRERRNRWDPAGMWDAGQGPRMLGLSQEGTEYVQKLGGGEG